MYLLARVLGAGHWPAVRWSARALLLELAFVAWRFWSLAGWRELLTWLGLLAGALLLHHVAHRLALGWWVDRNGERQKVNHRNRGHVVFVPTTRTQRITEEVLARSKRRKHIFWLALIGGPLGYFTYGQAATVEWGLAIPLGFFASFALIPLACEALTELLYLSGYQDMHGAKVLDPVPVKPGLREVAAQMAHGDARIAGEQESHALLGGER
jgi:hypothetical protein